MNDFSHVSRSFQTFMQEAPGQQAAWQELVGKLDQASELDAKTEELIYLAVLAAVRLESGMAFHVKHAKKLGATRGEIISAILTGLPAAGQGVIQSLPAALDAYDQD